MICPHCAENASGFICRHCGGNVKFTFSVGKRADDIQRAIEKKFASAHREVFMDCGEYMDQMI